MYKCECEDTREYDFVSMTVYMYVCMWLSTYGGSVCIYVCECDFVSVSIFMNISASSSTYKPLSSHVERWYNIGCKIQWLGPEMWEMAIASQLTNIACTQRNTLGKSSTLVLLSGNCARAPWLRLISTSANAAHSGCVVCNNSDGEYS